MSDQVTSTSSSDASGDGGGVPAGFVSQADHDALEAKRRDLQSKLDQETAKNKQLVAQHSTQPTGTTGDQVDKSDDRIAQLEAKLASFDPNALADQFTARFNQQQALAAARTALKEQFKMARPEVFSASYETPEEMQAAVEASHKAEAENVAAVEARVRQELAAQMKELHGVDLAPAPQAPATSDANGDTGPSTIRDLASMPFDKLTSMSDEDIAKALART